MKVPGGSRRENRNSALHSGLQGTEVMNDSHECADSTRNDEKCHDGKPGAIPAQRTGESEAATPSGVWLSAEDGTVLFHPVSAGGEGPQGLSVRGSGGSVEEADEATLDAAGWLMPLLPRELIAEFLQLGPYRDGGTA